MFTGLGQLLCHWDWRVGVAQAARGLFWKGEDRSPRGTEPIHRFKLKHTTFTHQNKLGNIRFYTKKNPSAMKIPFLGLKCICHSFLVALRKQKQCLKSCCRGGRNQTLLTENFITAVSQTLYCSIWNKHLAYFSKLRHLLRSRFRVVVPDVQHCNWHVVHQKRSSFQKLPSLSTVQSSR